MNNFYIAFICGVLIIIFELILKMVLKRLSKKKELQDYELTLIRVIDYCEGNNEKVDKITNSLISNINKDKNIDNSTKTLYIREIFKLTKKNDSDSQNLKSKTHSLNSNKDSVSSLINSNQDYIIIEKTKHTPFVCIDKKNGILTIKGFVRPENTIAFFRPIVDWVESQTDNVSYETLSVYIMLTYYNSSSYKFFLEILLSAINLRHSGIKVVINWYYEKNDEAMYDSGVELQDILDYKFNFYSLPRIE